MQPPAESPALRLLDPWGHPGLPTSHSVPGWWREVDGLPWSGPLAATDDPARLPGVSTSLQTALDSWQPEALPASTWADLLQRPPVSAASFALKPELTAPERTLQQALPYLQTICQHPRSHLRLDEFREPISRVRRISSRTVETLAAHSEDWQAVTFRGVRPARLLAQIVEEDWALYENRTLVTLRKKMLAELAIRIRELRTRIEQLEIVEDHSNLIGGSRFRRDRICETLSELCLPDLQAAPYRDLLAQLEASARDLRRLSASPLLRQARHFAPVRPPLRSTNLFRGNDHYRRLEALWRAWVETVSRPEPPTVEQLLELRRHRILAHQDFASVLTLRALRTLPIWEEPATATLDAPLPLSRAWSLRRHPSGLLELQKKSTTQALVLPLAAGFDQTQATSIETLLGVPALSPSALVLCIWLQHGDEGDTTPTHHSPTGIRHITVSPESLDSVEPVLRFFREAIFRREWPLLPLKLDFTPAQLTEAKARFGADAEQGFSRAPSEKALQGLQHDLQQTQRQKTETDGALADIEDQIRKVRKTRGHNTEHAKHRNELQARQKDLNERVGLLAELEQKTCKVADQFAFARRCPCCEEKTPAKIIGTRFRCENCDSEWGLKDRSGMMFIEPKPADLENSRDPIRWGADWIPMVITDKTPIS